tara:strand:- start:403 stop:615 length:213 start_codon:yes stop_codon:yes gene_type:complete
MEQPNTFALFMQSVRDNESLLKFYSKNNCPDCYGRGWIEFKQPGEETQKYMCNCAVKRVKKEYEKNGKNL